MSFFFISNYKHFRYTQKLKTQNILAFKRSKAFGLTKRNRDLFVIEFLKTNFAQFSF